MTLPYDFSFLATFQALLFDQVFQVLCQHRFILHQAIELIQVDVGTEPMQVALQPPGDNPVDALLVRVFLNNRDHPIHGLLQRFPAGAGVLNAEDTAQRAVALFKLGVSIAALVDQIVAQVRLVDLEKGRENA